uniref:Uncharacterized protein n=1 Tax=Arundo donax TaxID=35708 RepID=A0A0A8ZV12_ARUDO
MAAEAVSLLPLMEGDRPPSLLPSSL